MSQTPDAPAIRPADNAFGPEFLHLLRRVDEPATADQAALDHDWRIDPLGFGGFAVRSPWMARRDNAPWYAAFELRETALLTAAVLPALGRERYYRLASAIRKGAFDLFAVGGEPDERAVGRVVEFRDALVDALQIVETLRRHPPSLARVLEAAGPAAIEQVGEILFRVFATPGEESAPSAPPGEAPSS